MGSRVKKDRILCKAVQPALAAAFRERNAHKARAALNPVRAALQRYDPTMLEDVEFAIRRLELPEEARV